jgi:hypothetical protein
MTLAAAVAAALAAGAHIQDAHTHPMKLSREGCELSQEVALELVAADPAQLDKVLSWAQLKAIRERRGLTQEQLAERPASVAVTLHGSRLAGRIRRFRRSRSSPRPSA